MDVYCIDITLFGIKEDYIWIFFRNQEVQGAPTDYSITQPNLIHFFKPFATNLLYSTISFLNFIIVLVHKPFVTNNRTSTPFPKSNPVGCCKFHPPDIEVIIVSIQIKWNKLVETTSLHEPKELRIIPCNFLLENNVMKGFMYIRLYSNNNH